MRPRHRETHVTHRIAWLRAAVLGANDGIVSTASLIVGVAAAGGTHTAVLTAALAGLTAGAMSMAAGEYVSVSSQADMEQAATETEKRELATEPASEHAELANIYVQRGLTPDLARQVAEQLMSHDALDAHLRDELGIHQTTRARPIQAALTSALTYTAGALLPLLAAIALPPAQLVVGIPLVSLLVLAALGALAARTGGASAGVGALRVLVWGAFAMGVTAGIGRWFGAIV
jgi:VIT1/CCC1 family predicted Fe2+/Mn2+ transporter